MYDSKLIANKLIDLAHKSNGETLTPMQLLKLTYIAHGWMLGLYHKSLISDEVQAWQYGPVIPKLYNAIRMYRGQPVTQKLRIESADLLDPHAENILDQVYEQYGRLSGPALSRLTHAPGTPWDKVYENGKFGLVIPDDLIEDHYASLVKEAA